MTSIKSFCFTYTFDTKLLPLHMQFSGPPPRPSIGLQKLYYFNYVLLYIITISNFLMRATPSTQSECK